MVFLYINGFSAITGDNPHGKIDRENSGPKPCGLIIELIVFPQSDPFHHDNQQPQSHGKLREEVMIHDRERELHAAGEKGVFHFSALKRKLMKPLCETTSLILL